jgi:hypothetical protein
LAADKSLGVIGLVSGSVKMRSRDSISVMVCSASIPLSIIQQKRPDVKWMRSATMSQALAMEEKVPSELRSSLSKGVLSAEG